MSSIAKTLSRKGPSGVKLQESLTCLFVTNRIQVFGLSTFDRAPGEEDYLLLRLRLLVVQPIGANTTAVIHYHPPKAVALTFASKCSALGIVTVDPTDSRFWAVER